MFKSISNTIAMLTKSFTERWKIPYNNVDDELYMDIKNY